MWTTSSAVRFATSLLVPYLEDPDGAYGWSYGFIAFAFTLQWLLAGLLGPVVGWLGDRYGFRRIMAGGALLFIAGMILIGTMTQLWQFWLYFGVLLAGSIAAFQVSMVAGVSIWFKKQLGLAMGIMQAFMGLGTAAAIGLVYVLYDQFGLKWTFWLPGMIGGALLLLGTRYFRNEPAALGMRPFGANEDDPIREPMAAGMAKIRTRVFLKQAQRTSAFWNLIGIHFWGCSGHNIILVFLIAMVETELSIEMGLVIYITLTIVSAITRFTAPVVADRTGSKGAMGVCFVLQTFPVLILLVAHHPWSFFLFAVLFGIGLGGEMTVFPIINRQYYGDAPTGTAYGWQMLGSGFGMALGPLAGGFLWDATGEYTSSVILAFALSLIGVISILFLPATSRQQVPGWEDALPPEIRALG
jgi:MFS family permease